MPTKRKKKGKKSKKKRAGDKAKRKSQDSCVTFKPNNYLKILLSSHTQTLQANIFSSGSESSKVHDLKVALW